MNEKSLKDIKKIIRTLKALDWSEDDIQKFLKIKKEDIRKLMDTSETVP
jgi:hypothetical protein